jgi:hypothetical protein
MKRCPQCYQPYPDAENFCELDGRHLLVDVAVTSPVGKVVDTAVPIADASAQKREAGLMVVVGVMVGVIVTSIGYAGYAFFTADPTTEQPVVPVSRADTVDSRQPTRPTRTAVIEPSPAPEEEASPSPEAEETQETPAAKTDTIAARLNQGPVSTGEREQKKDDRADKTVIEMNDGTRVEVDAAWQDNQGVWYRRGGLVSFVESKRIKAIQAARQESKPDPVNTPTP